MASQDKIWLNMRSQPYKHGGGSFKDAFQAEAVKSPVGFDFGQVRAQLPDIRDPSQIAPGCVILNIRIKLNQLKQGEIETPEYLNQTENFMKNTAVELELQSRFAVDGYALPILGFMAIRRDTVLMEEYGIANILAKIRSVPYYPLGSIDGFFVIMLKCGYNERNGIVLHIFDSPPQDKQVMVDSVIDFINYAIDVQNVILYDFKPPNLCRSPFEPGKVVGLDFDPNYCINIGHFASKPRPAAIMKAYMFLMFACFQYSFGEKDIKITIALHNGLVRLHVDKLLDSIISNPVCVKMLKHYLYLELSPIKLRDVLRYKYIDRIAADAGVSTLALAAAKAPQWDEPMQGEKGGRKKTKRKKSRRRF
jgi:hypothetical protein